VEGVDFFSLTPGEHNYDAVCLFQVLEHMHDISGFFKHVRAFIKPQGKLIISVPNNNPYLYVNDKLHTLNLPPHHMGLWTGSSLTADDI
jgi:2-polyprenyl-3-methyl-5-hydroxy-6-metoxy-1,4-benzoquinol methylase